MKHLFMMPKNKAMKLAFIVAILNLSFRQNGITQPILSNDQLLVQGAEAYKKNDYKNAAILLFAYIQKNPSEVQKYSQAYDYSFKRVMNGVGVKSDGCPCAEPNNKNKPGLETTASSGTGNEANASIINGRMWSCNDGGTYYITVKENEVWWYGKGSDGGFTNVMHGTIEGKLIKGNWADVPQGNTRNAGKINLYIDDKYNFHAMDVTGGFGGNKWNTSKVPLPAVADRVDNQ